MKLLLTGVVLGFLIALGVYVATPHDAAPAQEIRAAVPASEKSPLTPAESAQLSEVIERVQREYVDTVSHPELIDDALRGVVSGLDPYSSYLDAEEYADLRVSTAGTYAGIGIEVSTADRALRVVRPFRDSPAAAAGIQSGDMISAIDGTPVGADLDAAMARMRGPRGSTVKLAVTRVGQTLPLEFTVERAQVDVHSVAMANIDGGYVYARITAFSDTTAEDFAASIARLRRDMPAKPRGVVLDLRNNPGGVLESAVEVADQLLETGVIVTADGRTPAARFTHGGDAGRGVARSAGGGAGERLDRIGGGDPRRRVAGSSSRPVVRPAHFRQGIGADRDAAQRRPRHQAHHLALLHAVGPLHPGPRHRSGSRVRKRRRRAARSRRSARAPDAGRRDPGIHAALELLKGNKPKPAAPGMTASAGSAPWK